ncbi:MAG: glycosyltransferase [Gammaproteobacteria bacterium]|nr:glycosyltransferase [Gammaproteobacteria bacterium]MCP5136734.1 glycosyltransferase [Gammaproteobacteria bacterium]
MREDNPKPLILIPYRQLGNILVREVGRAYQRQGYVVYFGPENFFESDIQPDIIHLHWPEMFYRNDGDGTAQERADLFLARLKEFKALGVRVIWTIHNLFPHDSYDSELDVHVYREVAALADVVVHHCARSRELIAEQYPPRPDVPQVIAPMGNYLGQRNHSDQIESRRRLDLPEDAFVFLLFGALKGYKGLFNVVDAFRRLKSSGRPIYLVVAGNASLSGWRGRFLDLRNRIPRRWQGRLRLHLGHVPADDVQYFVNACDAMILGHVRGLNSSLALLGMTFGKLIVGPDLGCIGWVLQEGRNVSFPVGDQSAMTEAMQRALDFDLESAAAANIAITQKWTWDHHAEQILAGLKRLG